MSAGDIEKIYFYDIPKISADATCSLTDEKDEQPYNLAPDPRLIGDFENLRNDPQTLQIWRLYRVVGTVMEFVASDWLGSYRKTQTKTVNRF